MASQKDFCPAFWQTPWLPGLLLAAAIIVSNAWWGRTIQPTVAGSTAIAWVNFGAVLFFGGFCFQARKWLALPVALFGIFAFWIGHLTAILMPVRLDPATAESRVAYTRQQLASLDQSLAEVSLWRSGAIPPRSMPFMVSGANLDFIAGLPIALPSWGSTFELGSFEGTTGANGPGWEKYGESFARVLPAKKQELEAKLVAYQAGLSEVPTSTTREVQRWLKESAELLVVLTVFNGVAIAFRRTSSLRIRRLSQA